MKKYFFIFILFLIMIVTVSAKSIDVSNNLNSNELLSFLKKQDINGKVIKVCNIDYCDHLKYKSLEKSVNKYIDDYLNYIKEKTDEDTSVKVSLKGFLITDIIYF